MREILFRGKRIDTGEWVYGVPVIGITSGVFMVWIESKTKRWCGEVSIRDVDKQAEVITETVGQYTGLKDKDDVKVFEGDIVNCSRGCPHEVYFTTEHGGFLGGMPAFYLKGLREGYTWMGVEEVIGNIHDKEV